MGPISVDAALPAAHFAPAFIRASAAMLAQRGSCGSRLHARHRAASGELSKELAGGARCCNTAMGCDGRRRASASEYRSTMNTAALGMGVRNGYSVCMGAWACQHMHMQWQRRPWQQLIACTPHCGIKVTSMPQPLNHWCQEVFDTALVHLMHKHITYANPAAGAALLHARRAASSAAARRMAAYATGFQGFADP